VKRCVAYPTAHSVRSSRIAFVQDGELAWLYGIKKDGEKPGVVPIYFCFDSLELQPGLTHRFRVLYEELVRRNLAPTVDKPKGVNWWGKLQGMLQKRYGIKWRMPMELNPGTTFD